MVLPGSPDLNCGRIASRARLLRARTLSKLSDGLDRVPPWGFHVIRVMRSPPSTSLASIGTARPKGRLIPSSHRPSQDGLWYDKTKAERIETAR